MPKENSSDTQYGADMSIKKRVHYLNQELNISIRQERERLETIRKLEAANSDLQRRYDMLYRAIRSVHYAIQPLQDATPNTYINLKDEYYSRTAM